MISYGVGEIFVMLLVGVFGLILPAAVIVLMVMLYKKVSSIEELLKKGK